MAGRWGKCPLPKTAPHVSARHPHPSHILLPELPGTGLAHPLAQAHKGLCQDRVCGITWAGTFLPSVPQVSSAEHMDMREERYEAGEGSHGHRSHPSS